MRKRPLMTLLGALMSAAIAYAGYWYLTEIYLGAI